MNGKKKKKTEHIVTKLKKVQQTKLLVSEHASRSRNSIGIHFTMRRTVVSVLCLSVYHDHIGVLSVYYGMRS